MNHILDSLVTKREKEEAEVNKLSEQAKKLFKPLTVSGLSFAKDQLFSVISERLQEERFFGKKQVSLKINIFLAHFKAQLDWKRCFFSKDFAESEVHLYLEKGGDTHPHRQ